MILRLIAYIRLSQIDGLDFLFCFNFFCSLIRKDITRLIFFIKLIGVSLRKFSKKRSIELQLFSFLFEKLRQLNFIS